MFFLRTKLANKLLVSPLLSCSIKSSFNYHINICQLPALSSYYSTKATKKLAFAPKICIVGSGPAALYTTQYVLKNLSVHNDSLEIDIFEKLPVPFGLVRYGVAPDHQDVKNVINSFTDTLRDERINFFGNVNIGVDVRISELVDAYNCVVLAYGSLTENYLNVPGEREFKSSDNFISAKDFVNWYNGFPHSENFRIDLSGRRAVIIGAGNVAIDIARILVGPIEKLNTTDISIKALEKIKKENRIEHVSIVARRGVLNAAFTLKELRELTKIESIVCRLERQQFDVINVESLLNKLARPRRRLTEYMYSLAKKSAEEKISSQAGKKVVEFVFLKTPTEIVGNLNQNKVTGVKFKMNKYNSDFSAKQIKLDNEEILNTLRLVEDNSVPEQIEPADLVIRSIGFKNTSLDKDVPFDKNKGVVPNEQGKVIGCEGLYATGWIKRGPKGVIVDTTSDAHETANKLCLDLVNRDSIENNKAKLEKPGAEKIIDLLKTRYVRYVNKEGWYRIDEEEVRRGKLSGKPREKLNTIDEMLSVALKDQS
jgi:adrenodoxin-NADP+ reductase